MNNEPFYQIYPNKKPFYSGPVCLVLLIIVIALEAEAIIQNDMGTTLSTHDFVDFLVIFFLLCFNGCCIKELLKPKPSIKLYENKIVLRSIFFQTEKNIDISKVLDIQYRKEPFPKKGVFKVITAKKEKIKSRWDKKTNYCDWAHFMNDENEIRNNIAKYDVQLEKEVVLLRWTGRRRF